MKFGQVSAGLALKSGLAASALQIAVLVIILVKTLWGNFDAGIAFSLTVLICLTGAAFAGFWLLGRAPEFSYFVLAVAAAFFLFVAAILAMFTVGLFLLPGSMALMAGAIAFLLAGEDKLPLWRRAGIIIFAAAWLLSFAGQIYGAAYLLNVPAVKNQGPQKAPKGLKKAPAPTT